MVGRRVIYELKCTINNRPVSEGSRVMYAVAEGEDVVRRSWDGIIELKQNNYKLVSVKKVGEILVSDDVLQKLISGQDELFFID
jgi:hypothetical protein